MKLVFKNIRAYENLHIVLWLVKDTCWLMDWRVSGILMFAPTLFVALHITWRSRKDISDLFHNSAVCFWIIANGIWMIGEFFFDDSLRPYSMIFFILGIITVTFYYLFHFPKRQKEFSEK